MTAQSSNQQDDRLLVRRRLPSVRRRLLLTVNLALCVGLVVVIALDYRDELAGQLAHRRVAMQEEATLLLPMLQELRDHGMASVQKYVDAACGQMQETTSPGHHIAVRFGSVVLQAQTHHRDSGLMLQALETGANRTDHEASFEGRTLLVGSAQGGDAIVYVAETVSDVLHASRQRAFVRSAQIGLLGLTAAILADWILVRLVVRPIGQLVTTVRRIAEGELGSTATGFGTAEFQFLASEVNAMSISLKAAERERHSQMEKARRIQRKLHPSNAVAGPWSIASGYAPAEAVGGDYLDYRLVGPGVLVCCMADVTGHGVPAALGAAMLKVLFDVAVGQSHDPAAILRLINAGFHAVTLDEDFASMFVAVPDANTGRLRYASAGHEPSYLLGPTGQVKTLDATGMLLGIEPAATWGVVDLPFERGDRLVMLTDGFAEATLNDGSLFGRDRLLLLLKQLSDQRLDAFVSLAMAQFEEGSARVTATDDRSLLVVDAPK